MAVVFEVGAGYGFVAGAIGVEGCGPEDDGFAVERAVALADGHGGLLGVVPDGGEFIGLGVKAGDAGAGAFSSVGVEEGEVGLQELAVLDHVLLAGALGDDGGSGGGEEGLRHVPVAGILGE